MLAKRQHTRIASSYIHKVYNTIHCRKGQHKRNCTYYIIIYNELNNKCENKVYSKV